MSRVTDKAIDRAIKMLSAEKREAEDMENLAEGIRVADERLRALESVCFRLLDAHKRSLVDWEAFKELERLLQDGGSRD